VKEEEVLCPWAGRLNPLSLQRHLKLKKSHFPGTPLRRKAPLHHPSSFTPHSLRHRAMFEQTLWASKKVVDLTD